MLIINASHVNDTVGSQRRLVDSSYIVPAFHCSPPALHTASLNSLQSSRDISILLDPPFLKPVDNRTSAVNFPRTNGTAQYTEWIFA